METTAKYSWSFSRNFSFLRGLFYYDAPCIDAREKLKFLGMIEKLKNPVFIDTVMVINVQKNWVTVAADEKCVRYVEWQYRHASSSSTVSSRYVTKQLVQLFPARYPEGTLRLHIMPSTPRTDDVDYGVYSAAYAVELVHQHDNMGGVQEAFETADMRLRGHWRCALTQDQYSVLLVLLLKLYGDKTRRREK